MAKKKIKRKGPRLLFLDIETKPILAYVWALWDQNVALNQIKTDWSIMSFAAKWQGDSTKQVIYHDLSKAKDIEDDSPLLEELWKLLDQADIVVTQNGIKFDKKKIFARFVMNGMQPPSTFKMIDTLRIAKRYFGFTSNKLEYLTDKLNKKYKKLKHEKYSGMELWRQCMVGNKDAWREMKKYNIYDILSLEELYDTLIPWDSTLNFNLYTDTDDHVCKCGSTEFRKIGFGYTAAGKFQRHRCKKCGAETRDKENLLSKEKRKSLRVGIPR